jgi:hypothetical protein
MGMDTQHGHGHAAWTWSWTCTMDMGTGMDTDYYWIDTLGRNYAKVRNYVYIDIVRVRVSMGSREITTFRNHTQFLIKITDGTVQDKTVLFCSIGLDYGR